MPKREAHFVYCSLSLLILLCGHSALAADHHLGTIFFSPKERAELVARRVGAEEATLAHDEIVTTETVVKAPPTSLPYAVSGIVTRSGGKSVAWINGRPVAEAQPDASLPPIRLSHDHVVIDGKSVKVGETLDNISGKRFSPLPADSVKVIP